MLYIITKLCMTYRSKDQSILGRYLHLFVCHTFSALPCPLIDDVPFNFSLINITSTNFGGVAYVTCLTYRKNEVKLECLYDVITKNTSWDFTSDDDCHAGLS